jgi:5-methylcytosine-specific restriction protein A
MANAPLKHCMEQGCPELVRGVSRCPQHAQKQAAHYAALSAARLKPYTGDSKWKKARISYLRAHPQCAYPGCTLPASVVDHKIPHRGDMGLFWDYDNWQPLCKPHHDQKTAKEDGGFGNRRQFR